ncbi:MAG: dihydropteroate synthase [Acidimicrobiia bacterium]
MFEWGAVSGEVMGIVNVTPDSFSDGGLYLHHDAAIAHGLVLRQEGAAVLDVGGESTRPGAAPVPADEEIARVVPVVRALAADAGVPVSIDTTKASVARRALEAGATIVNDVSAGRHDPDMLGVVADAGAGYIVMHMQGEPRTMQRNPQYGDVLREVGDFLLERLSAAVDAGVASESVMADPGIGFGKTAEHNLTLLAGVATLVERVGAPMLVGASRKTFIGRLLDVDDPAARDDATLATVVWALDQGASMVRVHDVRGASRAAALLSVLEGAAA